MELAEKGGLDYLVFECLGERTIALAQQAKMKDPGAGYDPLLATRVRAGFADLRRKQREDYHQHGRSQSGRRC